MASVLFSDHTFTVLTGFWCKVDSCVGYWECVFQNWVNFVMVCFEIRLKSYELRIAGM